MKNSRFPDFPASRLLTIALRDLRGGIRHLRLLFICLALAVAVMSAIGSLVAGIKAGIDRDAKALVGGDVELRQIYTQLPADVLSYIDAHAQAVSHIMDMRAMAEGEGDARTLIQLKAIDGAYPLYGELTFIPSTIAAKDVFAASNGAFGAAVDASLLDTLGMKPGDSFQVGKARLIIRAVIDSEPDRSIGGLSLGPRVMISTQAFQAAQLLSFGSMVNYHTRVKLPPGTSLEAWKAGLTAHFPNAHWHVRDWHDSAPGLTTMIDRLSLFFALTGITTLMVAGIGIGNATTIYLWSKRQTIATLKCLGATGRQIRMLYLLQLLLVSGAAIACGALIGALAEIALMRLLGDLLPVRGEAGFYGLPILLSACMGLLTVLLFALFPLAQSSDIKPAALFRGFTPVTPHMLRGPHPLRKTPQHVRGDSIIYIILILGIIALAIAFTHTIKIPLYFAGGLALAMALLFGIAQGIKRLALRAAHSGRHRLTTGMALANLARPGAATTSIVIALGIGMCLLIALTLVGSNLRRQIEQGLPEKAPAFFLIDIRPSELGRLLAKLEAIPGMQQVSHLPMVRGRIIKLNGMPVDQLNIAENARWALQGDRGLTYAAQPPANSNIIQGSWWSADYDGPPLVSFDANLARGMGLKLGDSITIAALDREITAKITNLRDIEWGSMEMNFAIILSPGALAGLPVTHIATVTLPHAAEPQVQKLLAQDFPSVALVRVHEALGKISELLTTVSKAVLVVAGMTIFCGVLVMASAIHASLHKRSFDTIMLKVLGVTRARILRIYLTEFITLALAVALISVVIGAASAYGIMQLMIFSQFALMPSVIALTLAASLLLAIALGLSATHYSLKIRPLSLLRNEYPC